MLKYSLMLVFSVVLIGCAPTVGSPDWCAQMKAKSKAEWSVKDATEFTKNCIF